MKQLAVIRFWYEGNAFSPIKATRKSFEKREWFSGPTASVFYKNTNIELAAVDDFVAKNPDIEAQYIFCAATYPAGPMETGLFHDILNHIVKGLRGHEWQGVYLSLHGSAVSADETQAETTLIRRVREIVGTSTPIAATFDLHANLDPGIGELVEIVCGYKTYPHVDMLETATKALELLGRTMAMEITPVSTILPVGFAPTSFNMRTSHGPMADILTQAKNIEQENQFYDVSAFGGFVYADTVDTGASISICSDSSVSTQANNLARYFRARAPRFEIKLALAEKVLSQINHSLNQEKLQLPIAIIEPSDNIFSGGAADTPGLLSAVLNSGIKSPSLFAFFWNPQLVQQAITAGIGGILTAKIGARLTTAFGPPVQITTQVIKFTDGRFKNNGPMEKNMDVDLGPTAILRIDNLSIIVTSNNVPVNDRAYFDLHGVKPAEFAIVYVKAKNHFRSAFEDEFSQIIEVETPGPAASNLDSFAFRNVCDNSLNTQVQVKDASLDDAKAIADIHTSSWRDVYKNILPEGYLTNEIEQERRAFWHKKISNKDPSELVLTITSGEVIFGFIWITRTSEPGYDAVIEALHIDINAKNCGYGKQIMKAAVGRLIDQGAKSICLRVFDDNVAAVQFYQRIGGIKDQSGIDGFAGANAPDSRIGWKDINALLKALTSPPFNSPRQS